MKKILSLILVLMLAISVAAVAEGSEKKDSWLCDEKTTLTVFCDEGASNTMPVPSNDLPFWAWLEDYTNVHIEWECIPSASYDEVLSARLAAGQDLADVIVVGGTSLRSAGQNGTVIDIAPYYDELCTNLQAYFADSDMDYKSLIATTDGAIYGLAGTINARENRITALYNTEWLQKLNLQAPTTLDEFEALLRAIKEAGDLNGNSKDDEIPFTSADVNKLLGYIGMAFGTHLYEGGNYLQADENGKLYDERISENMKNALKYLNKLFAEGLLDPEICNMGYDVMSQKSAANRVGVMVMYSSFSPAYGAMMPQGQDDPLGEHLTVGTTLKTEYNGMTEPMYQNENLGGTAAISAACKTPELAIRWLDTLIADENVLTTRCWGFEGEDFEYDADGNKVLIQPADGSKWNINPKGCGQIPLPHLQTDEQLQNPDSNLPWYVDECNALKESAAWFGPAIPNISRTDEEVETIALSSTDVDTYYSEMRDKFIKGEEDIDAMWDTYVSNMWGLGLENVIAGNQSVYDRATK